MIYFNDTPVRFIKTAMLPGFGLCVLVEWPNRDCGWLDAAELFTQPKS